MGDDNVFPVELLVDVGIELTHPVLLAVQVDPGFFHDDKAQEQDQRGGDHHADGQFPVDGEHHDDRPDKQHGLGNNFKKGVVQSVEDVVQVTVEQGKDLPVLVGIKVTDGHPLQFAKQALAHVIVGIGVKARHHHPGNVSRDGVQGIEGCHPGQGLVEAGKGGMALGAFFDKSRQVGNRHPQQGWRGYLGGSGQQVDHYGNHDRLLISAQVFLKIGKGLLGVGH